MCYQVFHAKLIFEHYYQHFQAQSQNSSHQLDIIRKSHDTLPYVNKSHLFMQDILLAHILVTKMRKTRKNHYFMQDFKKNPKEPPICNIRKKNPFTALFLMKLILCYPLMSKFLDLRPLGGALE
jgi:hypothetical protein